MTRSSLAQLALSQLTADVPEEGLIAYAERLARRTEVQPLPMAHLAPVAALFERAMRGEPVRAVIDAPVRHGKTTLVKAAILQTLRRNPRARINFGSYAADLAEAKMYEVRSLARGEGLHIARDFDTDAEWRTEEGGAVKSGGLIGGPWNGQGATMGVIDDPYKNSEQAESAAFRARTEHAFFSAFMTRLEPNASCFLIAARAHPNDLSDTLIRQGWEHVHLPAIDSHGQALWPERWPIEALLQVKATQLPRVWAAFYQGQPVADDGRIFDPSRLGFYTHLPDLPWKEAGGTDLAYGQRERNDRTSHAFFRVYLRDLRTLYLVEPWVGHEPVELYACRLAEVQIRRGGGPRLILPRSLAEIETHWVPQLSREGVRTVQRPRTRWGTSSTEQGTANLMRGYGARVEPERAGVDLLARVQSSGYQAAWSGGRILYPAEGGKHVDAFRIEHEDFTGSPSDHDDTVAAGNSGYELLHVAPRALGGGSSARDLGSRAFGSEA